MASEPVRADQDTVFRVGQVWKDEAYDGVFSITAVPGVRGAAFDTVGWIDTKLDHSWEIYDDDGVVDDYGDMSIIRRWTLVEDVSDETSEPEGSKTRWGVIDLDWLDEQIQWHINHMEKNGSTEYGRGSRDAYKCAKTKVVEL